ncbi:ABC transporter permease [Sinorhizobium sp. 6-70]|uniref:ABC transporter permease n=1 Tax=Sinorhizobium sp. 6-70 TaxID=3049088 RepID=UPI0024C2E933|nr:ABC transporter permease [Sinorhizobium sp. 6-70]MDK1378247.1 ABC transporter permease [Sinorhizobium sp. 6-70]
MEYSLVKTVVQRLMLMAIIILGVVTIMFILSRVLPGSPAELMLGGHPTAAQLAKAEEELGLNKPLLVQYVDYVAQIARGDFGNSLRTGQPVITEIANRVGATLELTTLAILLVMLLGIPLGVLSAVRQNSAIDNVARAVAVAGVAIPSFMLAIVLQLVFFGVLKWLPLQGRIDPVVAIDAPIEPITRFYLLDALLTGNWAGFMSALAHLALPLATLTILLLATVVRITRNMMVEVLKEGYIRTAFAYGLPRSSIYYRHALKATLIPILTVIGLTYGNLLSGAIVVEFIFDWPGLGGFLVFSLIENDFPAAIGTTLFLAGLYLTINLVVDLLYAVVDPRLRTS